MHGDVNKWKAGLLSICDPDLILFWESAFSSLSGRHEEHSIYGMNWYSSESRSSRIWVLLRGILHIESCTENSFRIVNVSDDCTILECTCQHGLTASAHSLPTKINAGRRGKKMKFSTDHFLYGGDYNPEQWLSTPEILEEDII